MLLKKYSWSLYGFQSIARICSFVLYIQKNDSDWDTQMDYMPSFIQNEMACVVIMSPSPSLFFFFYPHIFIKLLRNSAELHHFLLQWEFKILLLYRESGSWKLFFLNGVQPFYKSDTILGAFVRPAPCAGFYGGRKISNTVLVLPVRYLTVQQSRWQCKQAARYKTRNAKQSLQFCYAI